MVRRGKAWKTYEQTLSLQNVSGVTGWQRPVQNRPMEQGAARRAKKTPICCLIRSHASKLFYYSLALLTGSNGFGTVG
jgi:hypothetical protein